jgi:[CysO sulfur-carrier protein]-S-L-cysteine hydrolase
VQIARAMVDEMFAHALEEWPNECCGVVATEDGRATEVFRAVNAAPKPQYGYEIMGPDLYRIWQQIEAKGWDIGAVYHSHPKSPPKPSQTDINLADQWPDAVYLIVSLEDRAQPELGAFRIVDREVDEVELSIR